MKIGVVGNQGSWHAGELHRAAERMSIELDTIRFDELAARIRADSLSAATASGDLKQFDGLLLRSMGKATLQQIVFRMDLLNELELAGLQIINRPKTIEWSIDKFLSLSKLRRAGLPVPETLVVQLDVAEGIDSKSSEMETIRSFFSDHQRVVLKPLFGSEGRGIERFDSFAEWMRYLEQLESAAKANVMADATSRRLPDFGGVFYFQQYIAQDSDVRILVVGSEAFAVRRCNPNHWINNVSFGAQCVPCEPDSRELELAFAASVAVDGKIIGVDLMQTDAGPVILEVNAAPGWRGLQSVVNENIATKILQLFY